MRMRKAALGLAAGVLACGMTVTSVPFVQADPTSAADAKAQVDQLKTQASQAAEQYVVNAEKAKAATEASALKAKELEQTASNITSLKAYMGKFALSSYKTRGADNPTLVLVSGDLDAFSQRAALTERVIRTNDEALHAYQGELAKQSELKRQIESDLATAQQAMAAAEQSKSDSQTKVEKATQIYANLSESEKKKFDEKAAADEATRSSSVNASALTSTAAVPASGRAGAAVAYALAQVGKPYIFGGTGPTGYDCSGLMMAAWGSAGVGIPRTSGAQLGSGSAVPLNQLQPGDIIIYNGGAHAGMYIGDGKVVQALNPSDGIQVLGLYAVGSIDGARRYG